MTAFQVDLHNQPAPMGPPALPPLPPPPPPPAPAPQPQAHHLFVREPRRTRGLNYARDSAVNVAGLRSFSVGDMAFECRYCHAFHFEKEKTSGSTRTGTANYGGCCLTGKVVLPAPQRPPEPLAQLFHYDGQSERQRSLRAVFLDNLRSLNGAFALTSLGVETVRLPPGGP